MPTDTIYGLVGLVMSKRAVEGIYNVRRRNPKKPCVILISQLSDLKKFGIILKKEDQKILEKIWPGKASVILPCSGQKFFYLHRGTKSLAFRIPKKPALIRILRKTGPLLAPSANPEKFPPAKNLAEARKYFGNKIDFYINGGKMKSKPSTLIKIKNGAIKVLRPGAVKL